MQEELRAFMANLGYGEGEIDEFLMIVDEDCSGTIEWQEFLPAAGKFIRQDNDAPRPGADQEIAGATATPQPHACFALLACRGLLLNTSLGMTREDCNGQRRWSPTSP
jgi:hypothetical protein